MRKTLPVLLLLTACEDFWDAPVPTGTTGVSQCAFADQMEVPGAAMSLTQVQLNTSTYNASFVPGKVYDVEGYSGCWSEDSNQMTWIFEANGEPLGTLSVVTPTTTGNLDMATTTPGFVLSFIEGGQGSTYYGSSGPVFSNTHFTTGAWVVDSLSPLEMTITGQAQNAGDVLSITLAAEG